MEECKHKNLWCCECCGDMICYDCKSVWHKEKDEIPEAFIEALKEEGDEQCHPL